MFRDVEEKYRYTGNDLGATYSRDKTVFKVWSPFADEAAVLLYRKCTDEKPYRRLPMQKSRCGVWEKVAFGDLNGVYYTYIFNHNGIYNETIDVYARSAGANGAMGMVIDLDSTNPAGWNSYKPIPLAHYTDAVLYELHVRDFSIDPSGNFCYRGRFMAFVEKGVVNEAGAPAGLDHLKDLGITHVHLLPCFDFQTIDEADYHRPQFNWGYDPMNYNVPEGSYSINPFDGRSRVCEFKRLIHALHCAGIAVVMDVVYNHTFATADSCFTMTFPKYYYRQWQDTPYYSNGSGCGNEIATERFMVRKYIIDSLVYWATEYKVDGFRFDLMGLYDIETMNMIYDRLHEINPNIILYGEGWTGGDSALEFSRRAMKLNARAVPHIAFFSDDFRDTIKGNTFDDRNRGYINGAERTEDYVREVMCGRVPHPQIPNLNKFAWTDSPEQTVNYVEAHDNLTLWDKLFYTNPANSVEERIRMDKLAAAAVFLSQGIPFIQAGQEFLRSKPLPGGAFDHNSYNAPDAINSLKWNRKSEHIDVYEYYRGLIALRKAHSAFRMYTREQIGEHMHFFDKLPQRVVGYSLTGDESLEEIIVFFNPNDYDTELYAFKPYNVYVDSRSAGSDPLYTVEGTYTLEKYSVMVLGRPYADTQETTSGKDEI